MDRKKKIQFTIGMILICVSISACNNEETNKIDSLEKKVAQLKVTADETAKLNEALQAENETLKLEINEKSIFSDELLNKLDQLNQKEQSEAERILSWFNGISEPIVENGEQVWSDDGVIYYLPVAEEGLTDMQALRDYLLLYFDEENVDELLNMKVGDYLPFVEIDGVLYRGMGLVGN